MIEQNRISGGKIVSNLSCITPNPLPIFTTVCQGKLAVRFAIDKWQKRIQTVRVVVFTGR
jgi:hypothetical protein